MGIALASVAPPCRHRIGEERKEAMLDGRCKETRRSATQRRSTKQTLVAIRTALPFWGLLLGEVFSCGPVLGETLLINGGFESTVPVPGGLPTEAGEWTGDLTAFVQGERDITPPDGLQMMRFDATLPGGPAGGIDSTILQIVDLTSFKSQIQLGNVVARGAAQFNRVSGNSETDTEFNIVLSAVAGLPSSFPSQRRNSELVPETVVQLFSDGDVAAWQQASVEISLPPLTDFIVLELRAIQNVSQGSTFPEFDGHYVDAASVKLLGFLLGDMDIDQDVDFDDIDDFVLGLNNESNYEDLYGVSPDFNGDLNGDGVHDFDDIEGFVQLLHGGNVTTETAVVPEPASGTLLGVGLLLIAMVRRRTIRNRPARAVFDTVGLKVVYSRRELP
jgi:hypothetical protein